MSNNHVPHDENVYGRFIWNETIMFCAWAGYLYWIHACRMYCGLFLISLICVSASEPIHVLLMQLALQKLRANVQIVEFKSCST